MLVIIAAVLSLLLVAYVFAGGSSGADKPPRDRLTDEQAGVTGNADAPPPADPWATLPGSEGQVDETATAPVDDGQGEEIAAPPPPPPPTPLPRAQGQAPPAVSRPAQPPRMVPQTAETPQPRRTTEGPAAAAPRVAARPSFNCRNARTRSERAVCGNSGLANLDRQMAGEFNRAMSGASAAQRAQLQRTRGSFLRRRDACGSQACIAETYRARIREIGSIAGGSAQAARTASPVPRPSAPAATAPAASSAGQGVRPSFNCRNARTRSEITVCGDAGLAGLDRQMAGHFNNAMGQGTPAQRELLQRTRARFLAYRDRCGTAACIAEAYRDRMREINDIAAGRWRVP
jgi:uncharacterized protein